VANRVRYTVLTLFSYMVVFAVQSHKIRVSKIQEMPDHRKTAIGAIGGGGGDNKMHRHHCFHSKFVDHVCTTAAEGPEPEQPVLCINPSPLPTSADASSPRHPFPCCTLFMGHPFLLCLYICILACCHPTQGRRE
jgi:hypothetical protein